MRTYGQYCALARALDVIGQRWSLLIVRELMLGPKRFTDLKDGLPGIASNLLAERLRDLQAAGLLEHRELPAPATGAYALTPDGEELREVIAAMIRWGGRFMPSGPGDDAFRVEWLVLALSALHVGHALNETRVVRIDTGGGAVDLVVDPGQGIREVHGRKPDLTIRAAPSLILGLAAGEVSIQSAQSALDVEPQDTGMHILERLFASGAASA